jgi:FSR family fosmidomycin resistance protein-like MFS transporter
VSPGGEKLDPGPSPTPQTAKIVTIAAGHAAHDTYSAFLPPLLPVFIERLSLARAEAGLLTVFLQGPSLLQPVIGHLGDRRDLRLAVILSPAVTAMCMSLVGVAPGYGALVLLLVTAGLSAAVLHSVAPVLAGRLSGRRLGYAMGFWMVGGEQGRTLGPVLVVSTVALLGPGGMPWLMVGGLAASALLAFGLGGVRARGVRADHPRAFSRSVRSMRPLLIPLTGIVVSRAFMMAAFTTYLPVFLREDGESLWVAGASLSLLEAAGVFGALVGGSMSDTLGRKRVLAFSLLATPAMMLALLAASGWERLPILVALGFTGLMATPVIMASVQESFPEDRALANGVYMALSFAVRSMVVVLVGGVADWVGMRWTFLVCASLALVGAPFVAWLPGRSGGAAGHSTDNDSAQA